MVIELVLQIKRVQNFLYSGKHQAYCVFITYMFFEGLLRHPTTVILFFRNFELIFEYHSNLTVTNIYETKVVPHQHLTFLLDALQSKINTL